MIVRNNRHVTRVFFLVVFAAAVFGCQYGLDHWRPQPESIDLSLLDSGFDWIDLVASLAQEMLQLFLGLTSSGS